MASEPHLPGASLRTKCFPSGGPSRDARAIARASGSLASAGWIDGTRLLEKDPAKRPPITASDVARELSAIAPDRPRNTSMRPLVSLPSHCCSASRGGSTAAKALAAVTILITHPPTHAHQFHRFRRWDRISPLTDGCRSFYRNGGRQAQPRSNLAQLLPNTANGSIDARSAPQVRHFIFPNPAIASPTPSSRLLPHLCQTYTVSSLGDFKNTANSMRLSWLDDGHLTGVPNQVGHPHGNRRRKTDRSDASRRSISPAHGSRRAHSLTSFAGQKVGLVKQSG